MSTNVPSDQNEEIDLMQLSKMIGSFSKGIKMTIFKYIRFLIKNRVVISGLLLLGFGVGIYFDSTIKSYNHQIIVKPNFGSTEYLYSKIDLIDSKIKQKDTVFLKSIGIERPLNITLIEINPIIDIYSFVNSKVITDVNAKAITDKSENNTLNLELFKLLTEADDINKVIQGKLTSKNYSHYTINIKSKDFISEKNTIIPLLKYLNQNEYFNKVRSTANSNIILKMKKNEEIIIQIDNLLNEFSSSINGGQKSNKLVYYNENNQINEIISSKNKLIWELGCQRTELLDIDAVIKKISCVTNVQNNENINGKLKFILPLFFIFGFILVRFSLGFYNKQKRLSESNQ